MTFLTFGTYVIDLAHPKVILEKAIKLHLPIISKIKKKIQNIDGKFNEISKSDLV